MRIADLPFTISPSKPKTHPEQATHIYPSTPRVAVGAVVFHHRRVLLVQRANPPAQGLWAIPGGSVKLGETLQQAAEREILEETGIVIEAGKPVLTFDVVDRDPDGRIRFHYVIVDLAAKYIRGDIQPGDDALSARWVLPDEVSRLPVTPLTLQLLAERFGFGV